MTTAQEGCGPNPRTYSKAEHDALTSKVAELEAELAQLRAGQECQALNQRAFIGTLLNSFPLLNDDGLDETEHHCEWHIQQERKLLHTIVDAARLSLSIATPQLSAVLYDHLYKADPVDVANFAMMLHQNGQCI